MSARTLRDRIDRLEARREKDYTPPDAFALFLGLDRRVTLAELLDAASKVPAPPRYPNAPQPNVIDVDAELVKIDAEAATSHAQRKAIMPRKSLSDILKNGQQQKLADAWDSTNAAEDFGPLPSGDYVATVEAGELFTSKTKGTGGFKLAFRVVEGEHTGRRFWHDVWLTEAAVAMAKRDLQKIGVISLDQLERPLPQGIVCAVKLVLRRDDDGAEYNRVKRFDLLRIDVPTPDPFASSSNGDGEHTADAEHQTTGEADGSESQ